MTQEDKERQEYDNLFGFGSDMWAHLINPDDTFNVPTRRAPSSKELERVWLINNAEPKSNLISNTGAGGTGYRVSDTPLISLNDYQDLYFKFFMEHCESPFKAVEAIKTSVDADTIKKTSGILDEIGEEIPLLGNHYVTIKPWDDCSEANQFFKKHNKNATFIKKESKCGGCVYRKGSNCTLIGKKLAEEIPYTEKLAGAFVNHAYTSGQISSEDTGVIKEASVNGPKETLKALYRAKISKSKSVDGDNVAPSLPRYNQSQVITQENVSGPDIPVIATALRKLIAGGSSYETLIDEVGKHVGFSTVKELIPQVISKIAAPINAYKFSECSDQFVGKISLLQKDSFCGGCIHNAGTHCAKHKVSFVQESQDPVTTKLGSMVKDAQLKNSDYMEKFFTKCIDSGISYVQLKKAFATTLGDKDLNKYIAAAMHNASKLDPFKFSKCEGAFYSKVAKVHRGSNCAGCNFNAGTHCAKVQREFNNPKQARSMYAPQTKQDDLIRVEDISFENELPGYKTAAAAYDQGMNFMQMAKTLQNQGFSSLQMKNALASWVKNKDAVNAVQWNNCKASEYLKLANSLEKTASCGNCVDNHGLKCARFNKPFINSELENKQVKVDPTQDETSWF